jgi:hypothetical protein
MPIVCYCAIPNAGLSLVVQDGIMYTLLSSGKERTSIGLLYTYMTWKLLISLQLTSHWPRPSQMTTLRNYSLSSLTI